MRSRLRLVAAKEMIMKNIAGPRILSGFPQALNETVLGTQASGGNDFFQRFVLMNSKLMENAPFHIALHIIKDLESPPEPYAKIHCHPSHDEIGLIIAPKEGLEYEIILNGEVKRVKSPASVYIPAGTSHRAKAISGNGAYVCILLDPQGPSAENADVLK